jgi:hypothetical protein
MNGWLMLFFVIDVLVTIAIVLVVFKVRVSGKVTFVTKGAALTDLSQLGPLMTFARERQDRIADYVQANWSGMPDQLPGVLSSLMDQLEGEARAQGHTFSRELLKTAVTTALRSKRVAKPDDVDSALAKAA